MIIRRKVRHIRDHSIRMLHAVDRGSYHLDISTRQHSKLWKALVTKGVPLCLGHLSHPQKQWIGVDLQATVRV